MIAVITFGNRQERIAGRYPHRQHGLRRFHCMLEGIPAAELAGFLATADEIVGRLRAASADQPS